MFLVGDETIEEAAFLIPTVVPFPNFADSSEGALISQFFSVTAGVNCLLIMKIPFSTFSSKIKIKIRGLEVLVRNRLP